MSDTIILSPVAKIDVNGQPFGTISGELHVRRDRVESTDTETVGGKTYKLGPNGWIELRCTAHRDEAVKYHSAPTNFTDPTLGVHIAIWPFGRGDPLGPYDIPTFLVDDFSANWNVANSASEEVMLNGVSSGPFDLPG